MIYTNNTHKKGLNIMNTINTLKEASTVLRDIKENNYSISDQFDIIWVLDCLNIKKNKQKIIKVLTKYYKLGVSVHTESTL